MPALILEFRKAYGPLTELETIKLSIKKQAAETFKCPMPDDLAERIAQAIIAAPSKTQK